MAEIAAQPTETPTPTPQLVQIVEPQLAPQTQEEIGQAFAALLDGEQAGDTARETPANVQANPEPREAAPAEGADGEPTDDSARETEAEPEGEAEVKPQDETSEKDEETVEVADSFAGMAEHFGVDETALSEHLKVPVKIDGITSEVSVSELQRSYQRETSYRNNSTALAEERRAFDTERVGFQTERQQQAQQISALRNYAEQLIVGQEQAIDPALAHPDHPEHDLFEQLKNAARDRREQLAALRGGVDQMERQMKDDAYQKFLTDKDQQELRLAELEPDWGADKAKGAREIGELRDWAVDKYGFTREEADNNYDARMIHMLRDLKRYTDLDQKVPVLAKKLKSLPKAVKPGAKRDAGDAKRDRTAKSLNRFSKTQDLRDLGNAIADAGLA